MRRASPFVLIPLAITLVLLQHSEPSGARAVTVGLVTDASPPPPVRHGLTKLKLALERRGASIRESSELQATADVVIVAGAPSGGGPARGSSHRPGSMHREALNLCSSGRSRRTGAASSLSPAPIRAD